MMQKIKKYGLLLVLLLIVVFIFAFKKPNNTQNTGSNSSGNLFISPTAIVSKTLTPTVNPYLKDTIEYAKSGQTEPADLTDADPNYPLASLLPYKGDGFIVESYVAPLVLRVKVKDKNSIARTEGALRRWISTYEIIPGSNKITWSFED